MVTLKVPPSAFFQVKRSADVPLKTHWAACPVALHCA
jgi:hypothetical protein